MNDADGGCLASVDFLKILNQVLEKNGRLRLAEASPQWSTIQVQDQDRVLQILAGPGSGKTEVLVWRVLYEIFVNQVAPASLLVTTFIWRRRRPRNPTLYIIYIMRNLPKGPIRRQGAC